MRGSERCEALCHGFIYYFARLQCSNHRIFHRRASQQLRPPLSSHVYCVTRRSQSNWIQLTLNVRDGLSVSAELTGDWRNWRFAFSFLWPQSGTIPNAEFLNFLTYEIAENTSKSDQKKSCEISHFRLFFEKKNINVKEKYSLMEVTQLFSP